jgi:hypothetical protein
MSILAPKLHPPHDPAVMLYRMQATSERSCPPALLNAILLNRAL